MKNNIKSSGVFWGIALILAALLLIVDSLGTSLGIFDLPLIKLALGVILVAWTVSELVKRKPSHIFFPPAFLFILFRADIAGHFGLEEDFISVWTVLLCALLLQIGTSLVFSRSKKRGSGVHADGGAYISRGANGGSCENNLSSGVCYIDAANLGYQRIENNLGSMNVFIENADIYTGNGTIEVENNLGSTKIHIPSAWRVDVRIERSLGSVADRTSHNNLGPVVVICGDCSLGSIEIVNV